MLVQTRDQFDHARTILLTADVIAVDTETNWTESWDDRELMGFSTHCEIQGREGFEVSFYFPFRHQHDTDLFAVNNDNLPYGWLRDISIFLERTDCDFVFHGFKFDSQVFAKEGIEVVGNTVWDTVLMSWMDDENKFSHELDDLAKLVGDKKLRTELKKIAKNLKGWEKIPPEVMELYACGDTRITYKLKEFFQPRLEQQELISLYSREEKKMRLLTKIESKGIAIKKDVAKRLSEEAQTQMQEALAEFGYDPQKPSQLAHRLFADEPEGLGLPVLGGYSKRKSVEFAQGIPNMDKNILSRLNHPEALKVIDYRTWLKANSTWYEGWFDKTGQDGRIHPTYKQHGTKTGRLSCAKPNMQQIPRDVVKTPVKKMLASSPGTQLWEFDYSQIEFRLGAIYADCQPILRAYVEGADVHQLTSERIGIENLSGLSREESRYAGKQTNFLTIYGGGASVLVFQIYRDTKIILPLDTAEEILSAFHSSYPEFRKIANKCESVAQSRGYVKLWTGRRRHFDVVWECYKAFNSIVQGGAADIVCDSMVMLDDEGYDLVSQVHDSIWIEIPEDDVENEVNKIMKIMEWPGPEFGIPFPVDAKRLA